MVIFDQASRADKIALLEAQIASDTFWKDQKKAKLVLASLKVVKTPLDSFHRLQKEAEEVQILLQMGAEAQDPSVLPECQKALQKLEKDMEQFQLELLLDRPYDNENAIITVLAGAGGTDAQDWAEMLMRMYTRWAESHSYAVELVDMSSGEEAGIKSATLLIKGPYAYGYLKAERGVHRLVRISPFNANSKRQTSFAALEVIPDVAEDISVDIDPRDLRIDTYRASGAGGQHINKTDSAVRITHIPTNIVVQCQTNRSQILNREMAMRLLTARLYQLMQEQHQQELAALKGVHKDVAWGNQIRSYVFHPYSMVKDHRTDTETAQVQDVMNGDLDLFIQAFLKHNIQKQH